MERDNEVKGSGNSYTSYWRQYDPRLGRWMSRDPLTAKYPWLTPYSFVAGNPILFTDPDGRKIVIHFINDFGVKEKIVLKSVEDLDIYTGNNIFVKEILHQLQMINEKDDIISKAIKKGKRLHILYSDFDNKLIMRNKIKPYDEMDEM